MAKSTLSRHYQAPKVLAWTEDNEFVGTVEHRHPRLEPETYACYGWSKGGNFFIYTIVNGHIEKIGSIPREELVNG